MILAIDPGITGAYALLAANRITDPDELFPGDAAALGDLPVHQAQHGRAAKVRSELDLHGFRDLIAQQVITHCFLERVAARPGQGVTSMFRFGEASGAVYGLLVGLRLPVTFVAPQLWQKHHRVGPSPDAARQRAVQLFPTLAPMFARKRDHNRADALLLACYGRHVLAA